MDKSRGFFSRLPTSPTVWLPVIWLLLVLFCGLAASIMPLKAPDAMDWNYLAAPPGTVNLLSPDNGEPTNQHPHIYWLGTDAMGRDLLSRLVYGARVSLAVGVMSPLIGFIFGGLLGMVAGYFRGRTETVIMSAMDIILAFPGLVLLLAVSFFYGATLATLIPTLGFLTIPSFCRVARGATLKLANQEFILAAKALGESKWSIILREILPNVVVPLVVYGFIIMGVVIVVEGVLSFLGLGVAPPTPSWGGMIAEGRGKLDEAAHIVMIPSAVLFLTVLSLNLLGDGLRSWARKRGGAR
jgi:peptide/nickel transport system permease protein